MKAKTKETKTAKSTVTGKAAGKSQSAKSKRSNAAARSRQTTEGAHVRLSHPDRVYWVDVGVTKQQLADYYVSIWDWIAPHVVNRPLALVRCPEGTKGQCFFQKHVAAGIVDTNLLRKVDAKEKDVIVVDHVDDLVALVQSGTLEIHVRGSKLDHLDVCDRIVFDLDPGEGIDWKEVVNAAHDVRDRLLTYKLEGFVKLSGGKGLHVVVPIAGSDWDTVKAFTQQIAGAMAADAPQRYVAKMAKNLREGHIFIDYLRNTREATSVVPYSTRARAGAPVSAPVTWKELGRTHSANQYTLLNLPKRLKSLTADPWEGITQIKQALPSLSSSRKSGP
jgi:bifunctional non-homologous end joining protein LigD